MVEKFLKSARERGWTQADLASAVGISPTRISKWKDGQGEPTARQVYRIAKAIGVSFEYLLNDAAVDPHATGEGELTANERTILDVMRAIRLPKDEAIRRLTGATASEQPTVSGRDRSAAETRRQIQAG